MFEQFGTLEIDDRIFEVTDATLSGKIRRGSAIEWYLEVETEDVEIEEDVRCSPRAYLERYASPARSMEEFIADPIVIHRGAAWCEHRTMLPGCRLCCLFMFEHEFLDRTRIRFERDTADGLSMVWTAKCWANWGEKYAVDLKIETHVDFLGFWLDVETEGEGHELLITKFEPSGFRFHKEPGREGSCFLPIPGEW